MGKEKRTLNCLLFFFLKIYCVKKKEEKKGDMLEDLIYCIFYFFFLWIENSDGEKSKYDLYVLLNVVYATYAIILIQVFAFTCMRVLDFLDILSYKPNIGSFIDSQYHVRNV